ncbi:uncharacterized protein [Zea mays]|uniref:Precursor elicitor peptide3 n=1 Tax=Zea mays TaxID=4577 RepID=A0A1D6DWZ5_MAIZE|nr:uncharacterized protein LOC103645874 [Zea mays]ONM13191.1 precursor elicitor peptide3 [Zea mays]|eukprot:XP_008668803.1 uncharacterized protein LOC103645874 [Zea mays]
MDQRVSQESSSDRRRKRKDVAAAVPEGVHGESTDNGGYDDTDETAGVLTKEQQAVDVVEEQASAPLQLLLRACAGCLVGLLRGYRSDPKPAAAAAAASVAAESPQEGDKPFGSEEVGTQVLAATRTPPWPPCPPEEGSGGNGGSHN